MIRPLSIFLLSLSVCHAADLQPSEEKIILRAKVGYITRLNNFVDPITPVDVDPRYALVLRVESVIGTTNFAAHSVVAFAIHSYSTLFAGESTNGPSYDFELHCKTEHGKATFSGLRIRKREANKGASLDAGRTVLFAFERSWPGASELLR